MQVNRNLFKTGESHSLSHEKAHVEGTRWHNSRAGAGGPGSPLCSPLCTAHRSLLPVASDGPLQCPLGGGQEPGAQHSEACLTQTSPLLTLRRRAERISPLSPADPTTLGVPDRSPNITHYLVLVLCPHCRHTGGSSSHTDLSKCPMALLPPVKAPAWCLCLSWRCASLRASRPGSSSQTGPSGQERDPPPIPHRAMQSIETKGNLHAGRPSLSSTPRKLWHLGLVTSPPHASVSPSVKGVKCHAYLTEGHGKTNCFKLRIRCRYCLSAAVGQARY